LLSGSNLMELLHPGPEGEMLQEKLEGKVFRVGWFRDVADGQDTFTIGFIGGKKSSFVGNGNL